MTNETTTILLGAAILAGRLWSALEHWITGKNVKKTESAISEIKIYMNGEMIRKMQDEYDRGFQDGKKNKKLKQ